VKSLIRFLEKHYPEVDSFEKLKRAPHIEGWLQSLAQKQPPYKNNTRRKYIRYVRRFLQDISDWDWPGKPPPGLIRSDDFPPRQQYLPRPLPPEIDRVLIDALRKKRNPICLGLVLARWTGLRVGELSRLELDCLVQNTDGRYSLRVPLGKLHSERVIPIDKETADLIKTIRRKRGRKPPIIDPETGRPIKLLFCNSKNQEIDRVIFLRNLKAVAKSIGITENVYTHRLRHTYATELLRCGVSLPGVMKLLGHRTLKMTLRYVAVTDEDLSNAYLEAAVKVRQRYAMVKRFPVEGEMADNLESLDAINAAFDELVARIQKVRFDRPYSEKRKKLQRLGERLRRMQNEVPGLLE
jgi:integrase